MASRRREALNQLVEDLRDDPELLHQIMFNPEETLADLDYLDRRTKGRIIELEPESVVAGLAGLIEDPSGRLQICGNSCAQSCGNTCGGSCNGTCGSSCAGTCGSFSCGRTTSLFSERFEFPADQFGGGFTDIQRGFFQPRSRF